MTANHHPYQTITSKTVYQNPWIRVREDSIIRPSGKDGIYGVVESNDSNIVVVLNDKISKKSILFIRIAIQASLGIGSYQVVVTTEKMLC